MHLNLSYIRRVRINFINNKYVESYFALFKITENYIININKINKCFHNKMKKWHPDNFKSISDENSNKIEKIASDINFSRKILNDDLQRAKHILNLKKILINEKDSLTDELFIEEIIDVRSNIQQNKCNIRYLTKLYEKNKENIKILLQLLTWLFEYKNYLIAKKCIKKVIYYIKINDELKRLIPTGEF